MKKFNKIGQYQRSRSKMAGKQVVISEKIDGANVSISVNSDWETKFFSRNYELVDSTNSRGFFGYATELSPAVVEYYKSHFMDEDEIILYGEWLVPHTVAYKEDAYSKFYPFALYSVKNEKYLPFEYVENMAEELNLQTPEVFYKGLMPKPEDLLEYVGRSKLTLEENHGEGIVIFAYGETDDESRLKIVGEKFAEKHKNKVKKVRVKGVSAEWISQFVTQARVDKAIFKLRDEHSEIPFTFENFGNIAKFVSLEAYNDIMEEEGDTKPADYNEKEAKKRLQRYVPQRIREQLNSIEV